MIVSFCTHQEQRLIVVSTGCMSKKLFEPCIVMSVVGNHDNHHHGNNLGTILLTPCSISALSIGSGFVPPQERAERWLISRTAAGYQAYTFRVAVGLLIKARQVHNHSRNLVPRFSLLPVAIHVKERSKNLCVTKCFKIQTVGN